MQSSHGSVMGYVLILNLLPSIEELQVYANYYMLVHLYQSWQFCFQSQLYIDFPDTQCLAYVPTFSLNYCTQFCRYIGQFIGHTSSIWVCHDPNQSNQHPKGHPSSRGREIAYH